MKKDRRGIGGFMETMVAMMVVTITISAFMTVFAYTNLPEPDVPDISTDFLDCLLIVDEDIVGLDTDYPEKESERRGYLSMTICIKVAGTLHDISLYLGESTPDCDQIIENGTILLKDENGNRHAAVYEVIAFV